MSETDEMFIGWRAQAPTIDRRFLMQASIGLLGAAGAAGAGFAQRKPGPQPGRWDQGAIARYEGTLVERPYPTLLAKGEDGAMRPMLLVGYGKVALPPLGAGATAVEIEASAITRGSHAMLAIAEAGKIKRLPGAAAPVSSAAEDLGPATLLGEIVDAKCWFGAMNPGIGFTHKACAALCARGGLPLAFCARDACGAEEEIRLFLDERGEPHGRRLIPYLADAVLAEGRLVRRHGLLELRTPLSAIRRL